MPQGSSAVRHTNDLYLYLWLPFKHPDDKHNFANSIMIWNMSTPGRKNLPSKKSEPLGDVHMKSEDYYLPNQMKMKLQQATADLPVSLPHC